MKRKVAVIQSNYIPWKGYFDVIHDVDLFVFYDDVQFTKNDWRNRNLIKTPKGREWLTIPVGKRHDRLICEVELLEPGWAERHWAMLGKEYASAPYFNRYRPLLEEVYRGKTWRWLSELNQHLVVTIARECLQISTQFCDSRQYQAVGTKTDRLLDLLKKIGTDAYVSGPSAKGYIPEGLFEQAGIELVWKNYDGYPEYPQFYPPFSHQVTILDLLFQVGPDAPYYIWGWRARAEPVGPVGESVPV